MREQRVRLERAEYETGKALMACNDRERRNRVLIAIRHLIAWLSEGVEDSEDLDPDIEASRHA